MTNEERIAAAQAKRDRKNIKRANDADSMVLGQFRSCQRLTNSADSDSDDDEFEMELEIEMEQAEQDLELE